MSCLIYFYAECRYAECYAECHGADQNNLPIFRLKSTLQEKQACR